MKTNIDTIKLIFLITNDYFQNKIDNDFIYDFINSTPLLFNIKLLKAIKKVKNHYAKVLMFRDNNDISFLRFTAKIKDIYCKLTFKYQKMYKFMFYLHRVTKQIILDKIHNIEI